MPRLLIVSNRLPVTVKHENDEVSVVRSAGGLATAMQGPHERSEGLWIGWPGDVSGLSPEQRGAVDAELERLRTVPVHLSASEMEHYYDGFSNGVLWPLFHYLLDKVNLDARTDWEVYRRVNERFADTVVAHYRRGDVIWIHDYQLMLVPEMLRRRLRDAKIGFFLHIPFPAAEVFRILPWREQIARGLLGADLVGFHTASYRYHFVYSAARVLSLDPDLEALTHEGRRVTLGVHPIGVDVAELRRLAADEGILAEARRIREQAHGQRIVLGIDRLDYTKGIPRRLLAIERLLERRADLRGQIRFIQLAVPTRERVAAYADVRRHVHELVGQINGHYSTLDAQPIHYMHQGLALEQVVALYVAADVMLVTPLRDGMNLVAKEYVATRLDGTGALILSEFAGAAAELPEALQVNPYDLEWVASAIARAIEMSPTEQRIRMEALRGRVARQDVHQWAGTFLGDLDHARAAEGDSTASVAPGPPLEEEIMSARLAPFLVAILDYDGTLVPLTPVPELARPDEELLALLRDLATRPHTQVHVVSGRPRQDLERWLGALPIGLHAEHGSWSRALGGGAWEPRGPVQTGWKDTVRPRLEALAARTAGSFVEEKTASLAWHYRMVDPETARERVQESWDVLARAAREHDLEVLLGTKVLELRTRGAHKGRVVAPILAEVPPGSAIVAIGDDRTDEDLFAAVPPGTLTIRVGYGESWATYRLADPGATRELLKKLLA